jgi:hypothetical protein
MTSLFVASAVPENSRRNGCSITRSNSAHANHAIGLSYQRRSYSVARIGGAHRGPAKIARLIAIGVSFDVA